MHSKKILILAPHTDDGELGCGATAAKYIQAGNEVYYAAFSSCAQSLPKHLSNDTLITECKNATNTIGIKKENVLFYDFEVRKFPFYRQEILEELVILCKKINPDTVFVPAQNDVHQDHHVIYEEAIRAFKNCNLLGYELPWNNTRFQPNYFERLTEVQLKIKFDSLKNYQSQSHRQYMNEEFIRSLAIVRGMQSNTSFAEAFEVYRMFN